MVLQTMNLTCLDRISSINCTYLQGEKEKQKITTTKEGEAAEAAASRLVDNGYPL